VDFALVRGSEHLKETPLRAVPTLSLEGPSEDNPKWVGRVIVIYQPEE
jgi:hypothetical protein